MKELADKMRDCVEGTFTPDIDGVTYAFGVYDDGSCEIFDTTESENYRIEKFRSVEESLNNFIVGGKPIASCVSDVAFFCKR